MKHLALLALCILPLLAGCVTSKTTDGQADIRKEVALWTQDIGELVLIAKPEYRKPMEAAVLYLDAAESAGSIDLGVITGALSKLDAFQSRDSKLGLVGGRLILRRAVGNLELETPDTIKSAGLGFRDGLKAALGR
jgi:hypothetical protein